MDDSLATETLAKVCPMVVGRTPIIGPTAKDRLYQGPHHVEETSHGI